MLNKRSPKRNRSAETTIVFIAPLFLVFNGKAERKSHWHPKKNVHNFYFVGAVRTMMKKRRSKCMEDGGCFRVLMTSRSGPVQHTWILARQGTRRGGGHLIRCYQAPCHQGIPQSDKRVQHASFPQLLLTNLSPIERDFKDVKGDIWCWFWGQVKMQLSAPLPYV